MARKYSAGKKADHKKKDNIFNADKILSKSQSISLRDKTRKKSSSDWLRRHLNDPFVQESKRDGLVSRSAYKILDIQSKFKILKKDQTVCDIGCVPGGWLQVSWDAIKSDKSILIGIDILGLESLKVRQIIDNNPKNVFFISSDFCDTMAEGKIKEITRGSRFDVIISDLAPNATGIPDVDQIIMMDVVERIVSFAGKELKKNGNLVMKAFEGSGLGELMTRLKRQFFEVKKYKPAASRSESREIYLVCIGKKQS